MTACEDISTLEHIHTDAIVDILQAFSLAQTLFDVQRRVHIG